MDGGAWWSTVHGVAKSRTRMSDITFTFHFGYIISAPNRYALRWFRIENHDCCASLVDHLVNNLPAVQETWVRSLGWEDPLEKEMATHSSILAWKISWTEDPGGLQSMGSQRVGDDWASNIYLLWLLETNAFIIMSYQPNLILGGVFLL